MHKVIWKYRLELQDQQFVEMPPNARILCVQIQQSIPTIWAMVDSDSREREKRSILIVPTGYEQPALGGFINYIGTIQTAGGSLVFHVFEDMIYELRDSEAMVEAAAAAA